MRLQPAAFDAFLAGPAGIGQEFLWRPASACPCVHPHSGAANPKCPHCGGKGRLWGEPIECRAGMTQQQISKEWAALGQYEAGDATLTVPQSSPMYEAGQFDRITMLNSTDRFSLPLTRGAPDERLYFKVVRITRVFWFTGDDGAGQIVEGALPAVTLNGSLVWPAAGAPPAGKQYSITGERFAEYYVYQNLPSDRAEHFGARLPKKLRVRRFDLFGR